MGIRFQKVVMNMGIHFDSWVVRPHPEPGQVPLPRGFRGQII